MKNILYRGCDVDMQVNTIDQQLRKLGCSAEVFCGIAEISPARWSRSLRGVLTLPGPEIVRLMKIVQSLQEISIAAEPFRIDFRDLDSVRRLFDHSQNKIMWNAVPVVTEEDGTNEQ